MFFAISLINKNFLRELSSEVKWTLVAALIATLVISEAGFIMSFADADQLPSALGFLTSDESRYSFFGFLIASAADTCVVLDSDKKKDEDHDSDGTKPSLKVVQKACRSNDLTALKEAWDEGDTSVFMPILTLYQKLCPERAQSWVTYCARCGIPDACYQLAQFYENGECGFKEDPVLAFQWMSEAARLGNKKAYDSLRVYYENGFGCELDLSLARHYSEAAVQVRKEEAEEAASNSKPLQKIWEESDLPSLEKAWKEGDTRAFLPLLDLYQKSNLSKAQSLVIYGAKECALPDACYQLAKFYEKGECGFTVNPELAFQWMNEAARNGDKEAHYILSHYYRQGFGCEVNLALTKYYLEWAAGLGVPDALLQLSYHYDMGSFGFPKDQTLADYYQKKSGLRPF